MPPPSASPGAAGAKVFGPHQNEYAVVTEHHDLRPLVVGDDPEDFIRNFTAKLYSPGPTHEEDPERGELVASVRFSLVGFGAWGGDGESVKFDFADAVSGELLEIAEALFDENGDLREELDASYVGSDVLHVEMIEVEAGYSTFEVVRYLLEHVLMRYGHGCSCAVYYQANWESIGVARPLKDRGFRQIRARNRHVWFVDLGLKRPPLDSSEKE